MYGPNKYVLIIYSTLFLNGRNSFLSDFNIVMCAHKPTLTEFNLDFNLYEKLNINA